MVVSFINKERQVVTNVCKFMAKIVALAQNQICSAKNDQLESCARQVNPCRLRVPAFVGQGWSYLVWGRCGLILFAGN